MTVYGATKAAIEAVTSILSKELGDKKIRVNAVAPGPVATDLLKDAPKESLDHLTAMTPLKRLGQPADISSVVSFLAGTESGWVNGQTILVNGGVILPKTVSQGRNASERFLDARPSSTSQACRRMAHNGKFVVCDLW
jgi:NAD(P)-dependent dehydrogenase (short-subunit alcohol dehydrogenase family)